LRKKTQVEGVKEKLFTGNNKIIIMAKIELNKSHYKVSNITVI